MGTFIVIDGIDGCGKSTQVKLLQENLARRDIPVSISKWQDSSYIEKLYIGDLLKRIQDGSVVIPPEARTFLLGTDISYRLTSMIEPWLEEGKVVIGDRYIYKIIAQGIARGLDKEWLSRMFEFAPRPDCTILLDVPPEVALGRITGYREVSFYEAGLDVLNGTDRESSFLRFQGTVRRELLALMKEEQGIVIRGELPLEEQGRLIMDHVEKVLKAQ
ncbi:MAG TPA: dTMP kinase [Patescibacteria group bacterium]|nr:dTMP kinase [Patescibacteria group bacterium]